MACVNFTWKGITIVAVSSDVVNLSTRIATSLNCSVGNVAVFAMDPLELDAIAGVHQHFVFVVFVFFATKRHINATVARMDLADNQASGVMNATNIERFAVMRVPAAIHGVFWYLTVSGWAPLQRSHDFFLFATFFSF